MTVGGRHAVIVLRILHYQLSSQQVGARKRLHRRLRVVTRKVLHKHETTRRSIELLRKTQRLQLTKRTEQLAQLRPRRLERDVAHHQLRPSGSLSLLRHATLLRRHHVLPRRKLELQHVTVQRLPVEPVQRLQRLLSRLIHHEAETHRQQLSVGALLLRQRHRLQSLHLSEQTSHRLLRRAPVQVLDVQRRAVRLVADRHLLRRPLRRLLHRLLLRPRLHTLFSLRSHLLRLL